VLGLVCAKLILRKFSFKVQHSDMRGNFMYSNPSLYEQSVYEFLLIRDAQINTCFSIYEPIFTNTSSFLSQNECCSRREVVGNLFSFYEFSPYEQFWRTELSS
jgi:hypothetical protein